MPARRARGRWPDPPPSPPAGPIEPRYQELWPVPVLLSGRSTVHPCTGLALVNILLSRPASRTKAGAGSRVIWALLKQVGSQGDHARRPILAPPLDHHPRTRQPTHGRLGEGVELAGMPAKANLGRTAHICDPVARQNNIQLLMVVISGTAGIGKGRAGPALTWPAPASRRSYQIAMRCALATAAQRQSQVRDTRYEIRDTRYEIRDTRYEIRDTRYEIRGRRQKAQARASAVLLSFTPFERQRDHRAAHSACGLIGGRAARMAARATKAQGSDFVATAKQHGLTARA